MTEVCRTSCCGEWRELDEADRDVSKIKGTGLGVRLDIWKQEGHHQA